MLPVLIAVAMLAVCKDAAAAGATSIFSYPNGFAGAANAINTVGAASISASNLQLGNPGGSQHQGGGAWYRTPVNVSSFTTDFTFQFASGQPVPSIIGLTFCIQNSNSTTDPAPQGSGINSAADANMAGYGSYWYPTPREWQYPIANSIAVKFDMNDANGGTIAYPPGGSPNSTGLYINGGPSAALTPQNDLNPFGINLYSGHVMAAHLVYDGSLLTMTVRDTSTNAQFRTSWPINIPVIVGGTTAWVGFTVGQIPTVANNVSTWSFSQGYASRLATPTFNLTAGSYSSPQSVSISASPGATIYYTTNGKQPTTSSSQYTGPISVSASEVVQAVAVEAGYTDSLVAAANYQIAAAGTPLINFPSGFSGASNLVSTVGAAVINGSNIQLTSSSQAMAAGAAWYVAPVNVGSFTTNFTLHLLSPNANGMTFTIQNFPPTSLNASGAIPSTRSNLWVSGGPTTMANSQAGLGYSGGTGSFASQITGLLSSVAVKFDLYSGTGNDTGLYTNGADVSQNGVSMNGSGVSLHSGNPLAVAMNYNGTTLSMTITDTVSQASYSKSWTINIPSIVGGSTAYIGFTGSTGGQTATQDVTAWTYSTQGQTSSQPPVPMPPTNLTVH
jgi:hypothetical protein